MLWPPQGWVSGGLVQKAHDWESVLGDVRERCLEGSLEGRQGPSQRWLGPKRRGMAAPGILLLIISLPPLIIMVSSVFYFLRQV